MKAHTHKWLPSTGGGYNEDSRPVYQYIVVYCQCGAVDTVERRFEYKTSWKSVVVCIILIILCTAAIVYSYL
jgi:hypothetical protein